MSPDRARLAARPGTTRGIRGAVLPPGRHPLGAGAGRDGVLLVPPGLREDRRPGVLLLLHGAGSRAAALLERVGAGFPGSSDVVVVAPDSRGSTWDAVRGAYGPDVAVIDAALTRVFAAWDVDPGRVAAGGFSDGASYALSLGLVNGDLFSHLLAFSPGFALPGPRRGLPAVFVSHGVRDRVLPIDACSRRIVPVLEAAGHRVRFVEFDGGHEIPPSVQAEAAGFLGYGEAPIPNARSRMPTLEVPQPAEAPTPAVPSEPSTPAVPDTPTVPSEPSEPATVPAPDEPATPIVPQ